MSKTEKKTPELRFKGFTQDWEQRKLGELAEFRKGKGFSKGDLLPEGEPIILYGRLYTNYQTVIKTVDTFAKPKGNDILSVGNEVIVPSSGETAEDIARASVVSSRGVLLGGDLNIIKVKRNLHPPFIALFLSNGRGKKELIKKSQGTSVVHLYNSDLKKANILYPSLEEQQEIGLLFSKIEDLITLHQRKYDALLQLKKAYLQNLFPSNGESVPKLRFANFNEDWEQCKFGDIVKITMGQSPSSDNYTDDPDDYILVQGNADMKNGWVIPRIWTTQITKQAEKGDLILSVRAPVGDIGKTSYNVVIGRGVAAIKGNKFIYQSLVNMKRTGYWNKVSTGSTFESINSNDIKNALIPIPNEREQDTLGDFFEILDNLITIHQQKVEQLKQLKQAYLQKMFV